MNGGYTKINKTRAKKMVQRLRQWYNANKRDLPWRKDTQPYSIWVCEIMAQQTQIATLVPYYERFMALFPTVQALAQADADDVLKTWEGLGYYTRAHNLHKAAKMVMHELGGEIPNTEKGLLSLPGIGDYTAGAILSISFGQSAPAVDGNVLRVFARLENNDSDITLPMTKLMLKSVLKDMMPHENTGVFTQSIMELGALICTPKNPACHDCPLACLCKAHEKGLENQLPVKTSKSPKKQLNKTILLIMNPLGQVLMRQRSEKLLHGLWEFYAIDECLNALQAGKHLQNLGFSCKKQSHIGKTSHVFTHLVWNMEGYECSVENTVAPEGYAFISKENLSKIAIPTAYGFFLKYLTFN